MALHPLDIKQPFFSVIIPTTGGRLENLELVLTSLSHQIFPKQLFEVIVVNDGGEVEAKEVVDTFVDQFDILTYTHTDKFKPLDFDTSIDDIQEAHWDVWAWSKGELKLTPDVMDNTLNVQPRNKGAFLTNADFFIFADSDIILPPTALACYFQDIMHNPNRIILGVYHWLYPMHITPNDIITRFDDIIEERLAKKLLTEIEPEQTHNIMRDYRMPHFNEYHPDKVFKQPGHMNLALACFSGDTEVLTTKGFKSIKDIRVGDFVYSQTKDGRTTVDIVQETHAYPDYEGPIFQLNSKNSPCDFLLTPEHRTLLADVNYVRDHWKRGPSRREQGDFEWRTVSQIAETKADGFTFPRWKPKEASSHRAFVLRRWLRMHSIPYEEDKREYIRQPSLQYTDKKRVTYVPPVYAIEDWLELIGYYVSEGCALHGYGGKDNRPYEGVQLAAKNGSELSNRCHALLRRMDIKYNWYKKKDRSAGAFRIRSKPICQFMVEECGEFSGGKHLPDFVFWLDVPQLSILFNALMLGDGTRRCRGKYREASYATKSKRLAEDVLRLCLHLGKPATIRYDKCNDLYNVSLRVGKTDRYWLSPSAIQNLGIKRIPVYCLTTQRHHNVFAGRNGRYQFIGQCFSGNICWPRTIFEDVGGYTPYLAAGAHEDGFSGIALYKRGHGISFDGRIVGGHLYHPRNVQWVEDLKWKRGEIMWLNEQHADCPEMTDIIEMTRKEMELLGVDEWKDKGGLGW